MPETEEIVQDNQEATGVAADVKEMMNELETEKSEETPATETSENTTESTETKEETTASETQTEEKTEETEQKETTEEKTAEAEKPEAVETEESPAKPEEKPEIDVDKTLSEWTEGKISDKDGLTSLLSENETLKRQLEETQGRTHQYEYTEKLEAAIAKGIEPATFVALQGILTGELSDREAVAAQMKLKSPDLTEEEINRVIEHKYNQGEDEEDEVKSLGATELKIAAGESREYISELQTELEATTPEAQQEASEEQVIQDEIGRRNNWTAEAPKIASGIKEIKVQLTDDDTYTYKLSDKERKGLESYIEDNVIKAGLEYNNKGIEDVTKWAQQEFIKSNINLITRAINTHVTSQNEEKKKIEVQQPTAAIVDDTETKPQKGDMELTDDNLVSAIEASM